MRLVATITDPLEVKKLLSHLGMRTEALPRGRAREPRCAAELRIRGSVERAALDAFGGARRTCVRGRRFRRPTAAMTARVARANGARDAGGGSGRREGARVSNTKQVPGGDRQRVARRGLPDEGPLGRNSGARRRHHVQVMRPRASRRRVARAGYLSKLTLASRLLDCGDPFEPLPREARSAAPVEPPWALRCGGDEGVSRETWRPEYCRDICPGAIAVQSPADQHGNVRMPDQSRGIFIAVSAFALSTLLVACRDAEQGPECKAFVGCVAALDVLRSTRTNVDRFLPAGACWSGPKGAAVCESACRRGVALLHEQEPQLTCTPGGAP